MAIYKESTIIGHVSYNLAPYLSRRDLNKAFAEVTGERVNRGAGYGLEVPSLALHRQDAGNCGLPTFYWTSVASAV